MRLNLAVYSVTSHRSRVTLLIALVFCAGCGTTIVPPAKPVEPVAVFVLDHGRTPSLVLPNAEGGMTRYVYGDWNWYALRNTGVFDGIRALLWPTEGTLGRRTLAGPVTADVLRQRVHPDAIQRLVSITVGTPQVRDLRARLDAQHRAGAQIARVEALDLEFVPHPQRYTYLHNSNTAVAGWLRELGCETRGLSLRSSWQVATR